MIWCAASSAGYREENGVAPDSQVETFAAVRLMIDSWRWQGVPFYIRAGKLLPVTCTEIVARLRRPPSILYEHSGTNYLRFRIGPSQEIAIGVNVMDPEETGVGRTAELVASRHPGANERDAYERVLSDALVGDRTLFAREDYVEEAWRIVDPVLGAGTALQAYEPGTWGPEASGGDCAAGRLGQSDRDWRRLMNAIRENCTVNKEDPAVLAINTIRTLTIDAVQKANSGHPGAAMALAPLVYTLWNRIMRFDPADPIWPNRDRFVLSNGHASMLQWSILHLTRTCAVNANYETVGARRRYPRGDQALSPARQQGARPPGVSLGFRRRDHYGSARSGRRDERGHGDGREIPCQPL